MKAMGLLRLYLLPALLLSVGCTKVDVLPDQNEVIKTIQATLQLGVDRTEVPAADGSQLTSQEAVRLAFKFNPLIKEKLAELGVAKAEAVQASLPDNPLGSVGVRLGASTAVEYGLIQNLLSFATLGKRKREAEIAFSAKKLQVIQELYEFALKVRRAVIEASACDEELQVARALQQGQGETLEFLKQQEKAGNVPALDRLREEDDELLQSLSMLDQAGTCGAKKQELWKLVGIPDNSRGLTVSAKLPMPVKKNLQPDKLFETAKSHRLDLQVAATNIQLAAATAGVACAEACIPDLGLGLSGSREPEGNWLTGPKIEFGLPVFDQGQAKRNRAEFSIEVAKNHYNVVAGELVASVRKAIITLTAAQARTDLIHDRLLPSREKLLQESLLHFNAMDLSTPDLIRARLALLEARREYVKAKGQYWLALVELESATGQSIADWSAEEGQEQHK